MSDDKQKIEWLKLALPQLDEHSHPSFRLIEVIDGQAYAASRHRCHAAPVTLVDGFYCPETMKRLSNYKSVNAKARLDSLASTSDEDITVKTVDDFIVTLDDKMIFKAADKSCEFLKLFVIDAINYNRSLKLNVTGQKTANLVMFGSNDIGRFAIAGRRYEPTIEELEAKLKANAASCKADRVRRIEAINKNKH